jgi:hypothetical protein
MLSWMGGHAWSPAFGHLWSRGFWSGLTLSSQGTSFAVSDEIVSLLPKLPSRAFLTCAKAPSNRFCNGFGSLLVETLLLSMSRWSGKKHAHPPAQWKLTTYGQRESLCLVCVLHNLNLDEGSRVSRRCGCSPRALGRGHGGRRRLVSDDSRGCTMEQRKLPRPLLVSFFELG